MLDWGQALKVGGISFLSVFVVLGILALVLTLVSMLLQKILGKKSNTDVEPD